MRIKELRKNKGLSQQELANALQVSRSAVSMWEINKSHPSKEELIKLSHLFGVSTDYLLENDTKKEPPAANDGTPSSEISRLVDQLTKEQQKYLLAQIKGLLSEQE